MTEPNVDILTNPVSWVFLLFVVALAAIPLWIGGRMLRGTVRRWTLAPKIPFQIPDRNTWPFILVSFGLAISIAILSIPFEIAGWEDGRQFIWNGPFWIPWVGVALGVFYWPLALTPRWYKRWVNHEDYPGVPPMAARGGPRSDGAARRQDAGPHDQGHGLVWHRCEIRLV